MTAPTPLLSLLSLLWRCLAAQEQPLLLLLLLLLFLLLLFSMLSLAVLGCFLGVPLHGFGGICNKAEAINLKLTLLGACHLTFALV